MNKIVLAIAWLATAAISLAIGVFITSMDPSTAEPQIVTVRETIAVAPGNTKTDDLVALLQRRLKEAEDRIAEFSAAQTATPANNNAAPQQRGGRMSDEELALLKTQNPTAYAEEMRRREERDAARAAWLESRRESEERRDDFFSNLNTDRMSAQERETLASFVNDYQALRNLMTNAGNGQEIDRDQMRQLGMQVASRADEVRKAILKSYASEIGYNGPQSEQFAEIINKVVEATSLRGPGGTGRFLMQNSGGGATPGGAVNR